MLLSGTVSRGQTLETTYRTNGRSVQAAFEPVREVLQRSSAVIQMEKSVQRGRRILKLKDEIAYGTVISEDGYIATKASEIGAAIGLSVVVDRTTYGDVKMVAVDPSWDVALLKIPATGLVPVKLAAELPDPQRGTWVVANGATTRSRRMPQVGIIAASAREVAPAGGTVLGISLDEEGGKLTVTEVHEGSGAAEAGVRKGDRILAAGGEKTGDRKELAAVLEKFRVGDEVELTVQRKDTELSLKVKLAGRVDVFGEEMSRNDAMSGDFSARRSGFPRVIQHDVIANSSGMGGPLLDLEGRCLGMNIARANRCETYAIPAADLKSLLDRLKTQAGGR